MAKQNPRKPQPRSSVGSESPKVTRPQKVFVLFPHAVINSTEYVWFKFLNFRTQGVVLAVLIFLFYANSVPNRYAVDDGMVSVGNRFTKEGFAGIKDILTKDSFIGGMDKNVLPGGRYRPLSLVTFAVEAEFFGENPYVSHFLNVVLYALTCWLLLILLRKYLFPLRPEIAFVSALIFAVHPIHIEAVANIKGRDEILAMLCMFGSLTVFFNYLNNHKRNIGGLTGSQVLFFLALLSKENPLTFLAILPVTLYFFTEKDIKSSFKETFPFLITLIVYFLIRIGAAGLNTKTLVQDVFQDPYHLAPDVLHKYATIMYVLGRYLALLFFPYPLTFDYTYNQIPYRSFADAGVLFWLAVYVVMAGVIVWGWKRKNIYAYSAFFYIASISIVSNIVFNLGGMMGERFLFQPSIAFAMATGAGLTALSQFLKLKPAPHKAMMLSILIPVVLVSGGWIINRNADWYSNETLYTRDVFTVPNSTRANKCAGEIYLRQAMAVQPDTGNPRTQFSVKAQAERDGKLDTAIKYLERSLKILPNFKEGLLDLGSAYAFRGKLMQADSIWKQCDKYFPENEFTGFYRKSVLSAEYGKKAYPYYVARDFERAMPLFQKSVELNPEYGMGWYYLAQMYGAQKDFVTSMNYFAKAVTYVTNDPQYFYDYGGASFMAGDYRRAYEAFAQCKKLNPNHPDVDRGMEAARIKMGTSVNGQPALGDKK